MFKQFPSRLAAALVFASDEAKQKIADGIQYAISQGAAVQTEVDTPAPLATFRKPRQRSIRKGTQARFHAKRGAAHYPSVNHSDANNKAFQFLSNTLLLRLVSPHLSAVYPKVEVTA
ncbi:hypothetical protein X534_gp13 [Ralstonia phage RSB3]|uniref:Uncharacterized protein n=1 Tax=Ralstonia phage RSB3 TaxID=1402875 RepID=U3TM19_9CAUD|nr:hypothetical protein X534_gp13 [Ralstonia phage RSB3]BAN92324.1 hypothetical protein [Ralstonia phage RSB3]